MGTLNRVPVEQSAPNLSQPGSLAHAQCGQGNLGMQTRILPCGLCIEVLCYYCPGIAILRFHH